MQGSNPVGRWFSVIANLPIVGQLSHWEQLILNRAQILILDRVTVPDTARRQAPRADPATDSLRVLADTVGGLSYGQHAQNGTRGCGPPGHQGSIRPDADATPEPIRELADSAMLLSQGAQRAMDMKREADSATLDVPATTAAAQD